MEPGAKWTEKAIIWTAPDSDLLAMINTTKLTYLAALIGSMILVMRYPFNDYGQLTSPEQDQKPRQAYMDLFLAGDAKFEELFKQFFKLVGCFMA